MSEQAGPSIEELNFGQDIRNYANQDERRRAKELAPEMKQRIVAELLPGSRLLALLVEAFGEESQIVSEIDSVARGIQLDETVGATRVANDFDIFREWLAVYAHFFDDTPPLYPEGWVGPTD